MMYFGCKYTVFNTNKPGIGIRDKSIRISIPIPALHSNFNSNTYQKRITYFEFEFQYQYQYAFKFRLIRIPNSNSNSDTQPCYLSYNSCFNFVLCFLHVIKYYRLELDALFIIHNVNVNVSAERTPSYSNSN
jgi:hypothetical protein